MTALNVADIDLLKKTIEETKIVGAIYSSKEAMATLVANGLVEGNPNLIDPGTGHMAFRVTPPGLDYFAPVNPAAAWATPAAVEAAPAIEAPAKVESPVGIPELPVRTFEIIAGFVPPARAIRKPKPKSSRGYPFGDLEIGAAFFVPATEKRPDPKASMASTVSSANKRYADFSPPRCFESFRVAAGQLCGNGVAPCDGAYVMRVTPPQPDAAVE